MLHEERVTYITMKAWALESYFDGCRDHGVMQGWPHEQVMGYVAYTFEDGFERTLENIMWQVVLLVLSGGWYPDKQAVARSVITGLLEKHDIFNLLSDVPGEEADLLLHDLKILRLI